MALESLKTRVETFLEIVKRRQDAKPLVLQAS